MRSGLPSGRATASGCGAEPGPDAPAPGVQAYCYRLCLTTNANRIPIAPPADYDPKRYEIVARFIASFRAPPAELVLDFDTTDDPVHGRQERRFSPCRTHAERRPICRRVTQD